jgi:hypothetical protein
VVGQGAAKIQPDRAEALIGVKIAAPTPQGAVEQVGLQTETIIAALVKQGLAAEDIQPEDFELIIQPALTGAGGDTSAPYVAGQKIRLLIRDLSQVEQVLLTAVEAGANQVEAVNFIASDISAPTTEARQKAVTQAQNNADALAVLTGVKVGALYQIEELVNYTPGSPEVTVQVKITYTIE